MMTLETNGPANIEAFARMAIDDLAAGDTAEVHEGLKSIVEMAEMLRGWIRLLHDVGTRVPDEATWTAYIHRRGKGAKT